MDRNKRILFLLFFNITLLFLALYLLDTLQIIDYRQIFNRIPFLRETYSIKIEDPYLLEKAELEKKWDILDEKIRNYQKEKKNLEEEIKKLEIEKEKLQNEKENVKKMIENFEKLKAQKEAYDKRIEEISLQLENMRPEEAVKILEKQDDLFIIDILRKIEQRAIENGRQSIVPRYLALMDPEQSARIQRKMAE